MLEKLKYIRREVSLEAPPFFMGQNANRTVSHLCICCCLDKELRLTAPYNSTHYCIERRLTLPCRLTELYYQSRLPVFPELTFYFPLHFVPLGKENSLVNMCNSFLKELIFVHIIAIRSFGYIQNSE